MELLAFASFAALVVAWIVAPNGASDPIPATTEIAREPAEVAAA